MMRKLVIFSLVILTLGISAVISSPPEAVTYRCEPTPEDEMGPFYRPDATLRNKVGTGYLLQGMVKSARDCSSIPQAKIELWMTGPEGRYGDKWRATLYSARNGTYYFETHAATDFGSRPPHIHIRVTAPDFAPLVTQHYPLKDAGEGLFDLVLIPAVQQ